MTSLKLDDTYPALSSFDPNAVDFTVYRQVPRSVDDDDEVSDGDECEGECEGGAESRTELEITAFIRRVETAEEQTRLADMAGVTIIHPENETGYWVRFDGELWDAVSYANVFNKTDKE